MAKLFTEIIVEPVMLNEWVKDNKEKEALFEIHTGIMTPTGWLLLCVNHELHEADVKHWVPKQRKSYEGLSAEFQSSFRKSKNGTNSIPSYWIKCSAGDFSDLDYITDTKEKRYPTYDVTPKGNPIYKFFADLEEF